MTITKAPLADGSAWEPKSFWQSLLRRPAGKARRFLGQQTGVLALRLPGTRYDADFRKQLHRLSSCPGYFLALFTLFF